MAVFKNVTRFYSYTRAFFWYVNVNQSKKKQTCIMTLRRTWRFTNHVESKNNREFPLWYVLFPHHYHYTRAVDTLYFFPLEIIMKKEELL